MDSVIRLNKIIAIEDGEKKRAQEVITNAYQTLPKTDLFSGMSRVYTPDHEDGEQIPSEVKNVQTTVKDMFASVKESQAKLFDITHTKELGNTTAVADVVYEGKTILTQVPVTYLLFLEKRLTDIHTFIEKLPTLDPAETWKFDNNKGYYVSTTTQNVRTKKQKKVITLAEATDKHPAQAQVYDEDVPVGKWAVTKFSGAIPFTEKKEMLKKVVDLLTAVKYAREEANSSTTSTIQGTGDIILDIIF